MKRPAPRTFGQWLLRLNSLVHRKAGLTLRDLRDLQIDAQEAFAEGATVEEFFDDVIRGELSDLGFPFEDFEDAAFQQEVLARMEALDGDGGES